jgi:hypothetical protein
MTTPEHTPEELTFDAYLAQLKRLTDYRNDAKNEKPHIAKALTRAADNIEERLGNA